MAYLALEGTGQNEGSSHRMRRCGLPEECMDMWKRLSPVAVVLTVFMLLPACRTGTPSAVGSPSYTPRAPYTQLAVESPSVQPTQTEPANTMSPEGIATAQAVAEVESLYHTGVDAFQAGAWWQAADYFRQVMLFDPQHQDAGRMLAEAQAKLGSLVFTRGGRDGTVYSISPAGGLEAPLFRAEGAEHLVWSPDESLIAYLETRQGRLGVMRADGSERRVLLVADQIEDLDWSPDGGSIVFTAYSSGLGIISSAGGTPRMLPCTMSHTPRSVSWSPDGGTIVFGDFVVGGRDVTFITDPQGRSCRELPLFQWQVDLAWAPHGEKVSFRTERFAEGAHGVEIAEPDGSNRLLAVDRPYHDNGAIVWSPDGQYLSFVDGGGVYAFIPATQALFKIVENVYEFDSLDWLSQ
jgi:Tol biopolymer transport system component